MGHKSKGQRAIAVPGSSGSGTYAIGPQFCIPNRMELLITSSHGEDKFKGLVVSDGTGAVLLRLKRKSGVFSRPKQLVEDAYGNTLLTLQSKAWSWHERQRAYRGNSIKTKDILFSAKTSSMFQWRTKVRVFMAANSDEKAPDFKLKTKSRLKECTIYYAAGAGSSSTPPLAKITKQKKPFKLCGRVKDSWRVDLAPNVDYVFVVALFVMLVQIEASASDAYDAGVEQLLQTAPGVVVELVPTG